MRRIVLYAGGFLLLAAVAWVTVTALMVKSDLAEIQSRVSRVRDLVATGQIDAARAAAGNLPASSRHVHGLTTGPAWWVAAKLPYLGRPFTVARGTTLATQRLGEDTVPQLLDVASTLDPAHLRLRGNVVDVAPIARAAPQLAQAVTSIDRVVADTRKLPSRTWLGSVDHGRAQLLTQLSSVQGYVTAAARVSQAMPELLGQHGTKRYFVGLQNEAELRGTGGLPGAFAIVEATAGKIRFTHFDSDSALLPGETGQQIATGLNFGGQYNQLYAAGRPTTSFPDSNASPNFPYAAQIWARMWQKVSGQRVDGAIAVDPTVLAYFLSVTGPAQVPNGPQINYQDVVSLTQKDNYAAFTNNTQRKAFLVSVLRAAATKVTSGTGRALQLVQAASLASRQRRLLVWSGDPRLEKIILQTNFSGSLPAANRPFSAVILNNSAGGKLDYYLDRSVQYQRTGCGPRRDVVVTVQLRNNAPSTPLPRYVTDRLDTPPPGARVGDYSTLLDYYATGGAKLQSASLNGSATTMATYRVGSQTVLRTMLELPRGVTQTLVIHLSEPAGRGVPLVWRQPGVNPLTVQRFSQSCS